MVFGGNYLTRENDSAVQGGGACLAAAAWTDSNRVSDTLYDIAQANLLVLDEPR
jgi:hypothetical protein